MSIESLERKIRGKSDQAFYKEMSAIQKDMLKQFGPRLEATFRKDTVGSFYSHWNAALAVLLQKRTGSIDALFQRAKEARTQEAFDELLSLADREESFVTVRGTIID